MSKRQTIKRLEAGPANGARRCLAGASAPTDITAGRRSTVTITRAGTFSDPRYGTFDITPTMLAQMVANHAAGVLGQQVFLDVAHKPEDGAAAKILSLRVDGDRLRAEVEWTDYGVQAVKDRGFTYLSAEFHEQWKDNEQGQDHGCVLLGAGLTIRPVIKRLDPVQLSEPAALHSDYRKQLSEEAQTTMKKYLDKLRKQLAAQGHSEAVIKQLLEAFKLSTQGIGEDEAALEKTLSAFADTGKQLAEVSAANDDGGKPITLTVQTAGTGLTAEDVKKLMADERAAAEASAKKLTEDKATRVAQYRKLLDDAEGLKDLPDEHKKLLTESESLIGPDWTDAMVKTLADAQIKMGNQLAVATQLASMGWRGRPSGSVHVDVNTRGPMKLQEEIRTNLRRTSVYGPGPGQLRLAEDKDLPVFAQKVLAIFDQINAEGLEREHKRLAGESMSTSDTSFPLGFQRTVIREALSDLRILELVQTLTDPMAQATTQIPYETRDTSAVLNDGIVYEGQGIHGASIAQAMDLAYIVPVKLAMKLSNEVMHFSRAAQIDWDAYGRNVQSNARVTQELVCRRLANEMQRAADGYGAVEVAAEDIDAALTGATSRIKTSLFPIVRPHQVRDLKGNAVGNPTHPISITVNGTAISQWDGTGDQAAGTYWRIENLNLGYIQLCDEAGDPVTPDGAGAGASTITYWRATNVVLFDTDLDGDTLEVHLNGLLRAVGARKAILSGDRFVMPDFLLMSPTLNDTATNAEQFAAQSKRDGTDTTNQGDLSGIKGVPAWGTNAPGIDLGDERIIIGQRGATTYTVAKPFMTGTPFEAVDSNGRPTGQKVAYGEEYSAIHTPLPLRNRMTSVIAYSADNR